MDSTYSLPHVMIKSTVISVIYSNASTLDIPRNRRSQFGTNHKRKIFVNTTVLNFNLKCTICKPINKVKKTEKSIYATDILLTKLHNKIRTIYICLQLLTYLRYICFCYETIYNLHYDILCTS